MRVRLEGVREFRQTVENLKRGTNFAVNNIVRQTVEQCFREIQAQTPVVTGQLKRSEGYQKITSAKYIIYATAPYAAYVERYYTMRYGSFFYANVQRNFEIMQDKIKDYLRT